MKILTLITALTLCSFSWIWVSGSESQTVEVQSGDDVTLMCSNFSSAPTQIFWFRVVKGSQLRSILFLFDRLEDKLSENRKFEMSSNISVVFLKIKHVNSSDSGLYFCGNYFSKKPVIYDATYLEVQAAFGGFINLLSVILGGLTVFLVMIIIGLAIKIRKLQNGHVEEQNQQPTKSRGSDDLNYAAVTFKPKTERNHQAAPEREVDPSVIYSSTRQTHRAPV